MSDIYKRLVAYFGGQQRTAIALGVNQSTVSGWIRGRHGMSAETAILAQRKTLDSFLADQLRPTLAQLPATLNETLPAFHDFDQTDKPSVHPYSPLSGGQS